MSKKWIGNAVRWRNMSALNGDGECSHRDLIRDVTPATEGCQECLAMGDTWVHLRMCLVCGHVGCCDQSVNKHATRHFHDTGHPLIQSLEPWEDWMWCYVDRTYLFPTGTDEH